MSLFGILSHEETLGILTSRALMSNLNLEDSPIEEMNPLGRVRVLPIARLESVYHLPSLIKGVNLYRGQSVDSLREVLPLLLCQQLRDVLLLPWSCHPYCRSAFERVFNRCIAEQIFHGVLFLWFCAQNPPYYPLPSIRSGMRIPSCVLLMSALR